jgi:hypothetical protein
MKKFPRPYLANRASFINTPNQRRKGDFLLWFKGILKRLCSQGTKTIEQFKTQNFCILCLTNSCFPGKDG